MASETRAVLEKARYFLAQAEATEPAAHNSGDEMPFAANIEAAVVFGRSVTFHLQKEFSDRNNFANWYAQVQARLRANAQFHYLVSARNFILKEGPTPIRRAVQTTLSFAIGVFATTKTTVAPEQSWYQRSTRMLYDRIRVTLLEPVRRWKLKRRVMRENKAAQVQQTVRFCFYFVDPAVAQVPAVQVVRDYLDELGMIVAEAETLFLAANHCAP
jgi:hypothetical protein